MTAFWVGVWLIGIAYGILEIDKARQAQQRRLMLRRKIDKLLSEREARDEGFA